MKYLILCSLLLLSLVPLSCSQNQETCEWREVAKFQADYDYISSTYSKQQEPFSVTGGKFRLQWVAGRPAEYAQGVTYFSIAVYQYPDMKLVESPVDEKDVGEEATAHEVEVQAGKGMYCLYISCGESVVWVVNVDECV